jgi:hypothetical protein
MYLLDQAAVSSLQLSPAASAESNPSPLHLHQHRQFAIAKLLHLSPSEIARCDIAEMNLICAYGLTGKHDIEMEAMLKLLDVWTKRCQTYITQKTSVYHANPNKFCSFAKFRVMAIAQVLTKQLGVRYNPRIEGQPGEHVKPITDPQDTFIHGILGARRTGTCATLPIVMIAIGRRLGYPLKLVIAPGHLFCRWDSPDERFNIEYDELGMSFHPDDHYKEWPFKWPQAIHDQERVKPFYLISLSPQQELANFAWARAYHLNVVGGTRRREALATMVTAQNLWPCKTHAVWCTHLTTKALYPEREWPHAPCEETAGRAAMERLVIEKGIKFVESGTTGWAKGANE